MPTLRFELKALFDYQATSREEISIKSGDELILMESSGNWWLIQKDKDTGYIPFNYVDIVNTLVKSNYDFYVSIPNVLPMKVCSNFHFFYFIIFNS